MENRVKALESNVSTVAVEIKELQRNYEQIKNTLTQIEKDLKNLSVQLEKNRLEEYKQYQEMLAPFNERIRANESNIVNIYSKVEKDCKEIADTVHEKIKEDLGRTTKIIWTLLTSTGAIIFFLLSQNMNETATEIKKHMKDYTLLENRVSVLETIQRQKHE